MTYLFHNSETSPNVELSIRTLQKTFESKKIQGKIFCQMFFFLQIICISTHLRIFWKDSTHIYLIIMYSLYLLALFITHINIHTKMHDLPK